MDYGPILAELDLPIIAVNSAGAPTDEAGIRAVEPQRNPLSAVPGTR